MRGPYAKVAARNAALLERIRDLKADHPFWGYRRIWAYLRYVDGLIVNPQAGLRRHEGGRPPREAEPQAPRQTQGRHDEAQADRPNQWWGIDMTKVMIEGFGWVYLVVVLDWHTKKVVGHYAGLQARAWHWLVALNRAVNRQFPDGVSDQGLNLMADNGCQPTALAFLRACAAMGIRQAFTSYNNPKGNADTERFLRTLKEELVWLHEWTSPAVFFAALDQLDQPATTPATCTRPSATARPRPSKPNTSATPLPYRPLAKRGAVHELADQALEARVFAFEPALALWDAGRLEHFGFGEQHLAPLVVLRLADLMLGAPSSPIGRPFSPSRTISAFCSGFHRRRLMAVLPGQTATPSSLSLSPFKTGSRIPNLASFCGARSDRMARSANMPSCRRNSPSTR